MERKVEATDRKLTQSEEKDKNGCLFICVQLSHACLVRYDGTASPSKGFQFPPPMQSIFAGLFVQQPLQCGPEIMQSIATNSLCQGSMKIERERKME